jgi:hypothetical protein
MTWPFDPVGALSDWLRWGAATQEVWMSDMGDARAIARQREARLQALLEAAAARSPVYRPRFADAPAGVAGFARLAPIGKVELMGHFDEWVTDPEIRLDEVLPFIADPQRIGEQYLGRYTVWTSSGSTGSPGVFVQDARALSIYDALSTLRCPAGAMAASPLRSLAAGHRFAMIVALGGHFAASCPGSGCDPPIHGFGLTVRSRCWSRSLAGRRPQRLGSAGDRQLSHLPRGRT